MWDTFNMKRLWFFLNDMRNFFRGLSCKWKGHPGLVREWEWKSTMPLWVPREMWTCIHCNCDIINPSFMTPRYAVNRPLMTEEMHEFIRRIEERSGGIAQIRVRHTKSDLIPIVYTGEPVHEE